MEVVKNVVRNPTNDRRYNGDENTLSCCNFIGSTTNNPKSLADKLYSPFLPFAQISKDWIRFYKKAGYCGNQTDIYLVKEKFIKEAVKLATDQGIACEPSGVAGLAMLLQMKNSIPKHKKILIVNTGKLKI
jgi:threonine synthase